MELDLCQPFHITVEAHTSQRLQFEVNQERLSAAEKTGGAGMGVHGLRMRL